MLRNVWSKKKDWCSLFSRDGCNWLHRSSSLPFFVASNLDVQTKQQKSSRDKKGVKILCFFLMLLQAGNVGLTIKKEHPSKACGFILYRWWLQEAFVWPLRTGWRRYSCLVTLAKAQRFTWCSKKLLHTEKSCLHSTQVAISQLFATLSRQRQEQLGQFIGLAWPAPQGRKSHERRVKKRRGLGRSSQGFHKGWKKEKRAVWETHLLEKEGKTGRKRERERNDLPRFRQTHIDMETSFEPCLHSRTTLPMGWETVCVTQS